MYHEDIVLMKYNYLVTGFSRETFTDFHYHHYGYDLYGECQDNPDSLYGGNKHFLKKVVDLIVAKLV